MHSFPAQRTREYHAPLGGLLQARQAIRGPGGHGFSRTPGDRQRYRQAR